MAAAVAVRVSGSVGLRRKMMMYDVSDLQFGMLTLFIELIFRCHDVFFTNMKWKNTEIIKS